MKNSSEFVMGNHLWTSFSHREVNLRGFALGNLVTIVGLGQNFITFLECGGFDFIKLKSQQ